MTSATAYELEKCPISFSTNSPLTTPDSFNRVPADLMAITVIIADWLLTSSYRINVGSVVSARTLL